MQNKVVNMLLNEKSSKANIEDIQRKYDQS